MRSFLLDAISRSLKECAPSAVRGALVTAFMATLAMPETEERVAQETDAGEPKDQLIASLTRLDTKEQLQTDALRNLLSIDDAKVESLLPQAEPRVRGTLFNMMVLQAVDTGNLDTALRLLNQLPQGSIFAYGAATKLMLELPQNREADIQILFRRAMEADRNQHVTIVGGDDFGSMIVRFWQHIPAAVALDAIHQVLAESQSNKDSVSIGSGPSRVAFSTEHDFRLFELVPVLRQLDESEADKIVSDSPEAKAQLEQFPKGIQSIDPTVRDTLLRKGEGGGTTGVAGQTLGSVLAEAVGSDAYNARISEIIAMAENNPRPAITAASALPLSAASIAPRSKALIGVARVAMKKDPAATRDALESMANSLKDVEPSAHYGQRDYYADGIEIAVHIGEIELAKRLLKGGMDEAEALRRKDIDANDPNLAFKGWWPSAAVLTRLVQSASRISPQTALDAIAEISDPELHALCEVTLANVNLGVPVQGGVVMVTNRSTQWAEFGGGAQQ